MKLNRLSLEDKGLFDKYLAFKKHDLCVYSFENIYIWKGLFDIRWIILEDALCVFFIDKTGCFLYLSPLSNMIKPQVTEKVFKIMDSYNSNIEISRIENVDESDIEHYRKRGYQLRRKSFDYVCLRTDLANLRGGLYKHKRASVNSFLKNYTYEYLPFSKGDKSACLDLYNSWSAQRRGKYADDIYRGMINDSLAALKILLKDYDKLRYIGRVVKIGRDLRAFTFGFTLNRDTFCIFYEITDLLVKGLAQFTFQRFCRELKEYVYINIMDDSGLENLRQVKLSYKPARLRPSFIVRRQ